MNLSFLSHQRGLRSILLLTTLMLVLVIVPAELKAQNVPGTEADITFTEETYSSEEKEEARKQLLRILSAYDLDPWIITREIKIEEDVDPHSRPVLTMNTNFLDSDKMQLAIFIHEQAHWLPFDKQQAAGRELGELFPDIDGLPGMNEVSEDQRDRLARIRQRIYRHMVVCWVEFDGMVELVGEDEARKIINEKNRRIVEKPYSNLDKVFLWYFERVLEDTEQVGRVLARHDLIVTPEKGVVISSAE